MNDFFPICFPAFLETPSNLFLFPYIVCTRGWARLDLGQTTGCSTQAGDVEQRHVEISELQRRILLSDDQARFYRSTPIPFSNNGYE